MHNKINLLYKEESFKIVGCAMEVINELGHGFSEKVYENAMAVELNLQDISFLQQKRFDVDYKKYKVGEYVPDLVVFDKIIVEMKTIEKITDHERGQVINYLKTTGFKLGMILNFKHAKLEWERIVLEKSGKLNLTADGR